MPGPLLKLAKSELPGVECGFFFMLPNDTNIQLELLTVGLREPALVQFYVGRKKKKRENKSFKEKNGIKISNTFIG